MISYQYCIICHQSLHILSQYGPLVPWLTASAHCCDLLILLLQITLCLPRNWEQIWHYDIPLLKWQLFTNETKYFKEFENVEWWILLLSSVLVVRTRVSEESHGFHCLPFRSAFCQSRIFSKNRVARSLVFCVVFYRPFFVPFSLFLLAIALSVLLLTASDCPFAFFKLFSPTDLSQVTSFGWGEPSRWRIVRL
jgi:hypothetical protein